MAVTKCYAMNGFIEGHFLYGFCYSAGLDALGKRLKKISARVQVLPTFGFSNLTDTTCSKDMKKSTTIPSYMR